MEIKIKDFEAGRHHITPEMRMPTCDILFRGSEFDCILFTFNQIDAN
jgi:hypothetical protein